MKKSGFLGKLIIFLLGLCFIISSITLSIIRYYTRIIYTLDFIGILMILLSSVPSRNDENKQITIKEISVIGIQGAISAMLYIYVKFPIPFLFPSFLDIQISEIPALITSFMYGPVSGIMVLLVRFIIKLPMTGTMGVGEIADLIISCILIISSGLIYKKNRTLKGAIIGLISGIILSTIAACLTNCYILLPFYLELFFHGNLNSLLKSLIVIPNINSQNYMLLYIFISVLPFNLLRFSIVFILTLLLYKRVNFIFKKFTK